MSMCASDGCKSESVEESVSRVHIAGSVAQFVGGELGEQMAVAHQQQFLAVFGFVHDVAGHQQGGSAGEQWRESFPQFDTKYRIEPDGGLVEDQASRVWRPARRPATPGCCPPESSSPRFWSRSAQADGVDRLPRRLRRRPYSAPK